MIDSQTRRLRRISSLLALVMVPVAEAALNCPSQPEQINRDYRAGIEAAVGRVAVLKAAEARAQIDVESRNLLERVPNADRVYVIQMTAASLCSVLSQSKTLTDREKVETLSAFYDRAMNAQSNATTRPTATKVENGPGQSSKPPRPAAGIPTAIQPAQSCETRILAERETRLQQMVSCQADRDGLRSALELEKKRGDEYAAKKSSDQAMIEMTRMLVDARLKQDAMTLQAQGGSAPATSPSIFAQVLADSDPAACDKSLRMAFEKLGAKARDVQGGISANLGSEYTILANCGSPTLIVVAGPSFAVAQNVVAALIGHAKAP